MRFFNKRAVLVHSGSEKTRHGRLIDCHYFFDSLVKFWFHVNEFFDVLPLLKQVGFWIQAGAAAKDGPTLPNPREDAPSLKILDAILFIPFLTCIQCKNIKPNDWFMAIF
jgi:hypothetical protein